VISADGRPILITGGAGFIGTNLADRLAGTGQRVIVYDNLSAEGARRNLRWLRDRHGDLIEAAIADIREAGSLYEAVRGVRHVVHLAAQRPVTTNLRAPGEDFEVNARGTLNVLVALRAVPQRPSLLFASTSNVYGALDDLMLEEHGDRYVPVDERVRDSGIDEQRPVDLSSPYGCSKGCADEYVLDHARTYGLRAAVFRLSCVYGPHQRGTDDDSWVTHFVTRALSRRPITLHGDGRQVRDALFVEDLIDAMSAAERLLDSTPSAIVGRAFNIGGGPENAISARDLLRRIAACTGEPIEPVFGPWRAGDQRYYVSDVRRFSRLTGWRPSVRLSAGLGRLHRALAPLRDVGSLPRPAASITEELGAS
jgi:CDP-paratose 2-epimerase